MNSKNSFPPPEAWPEDFLFAMFALCMQELQRRWPDAYKEASDSLPKAGPRMQELAQVMDDAFLAARPAKGRA